MIGGAVIGGSFRSDCTGEDLNGDGFGDTLLPYTSGSGIVVGRDLAPLVPGTPPDAFVLLQTLRGDVAPRRSTGAPG